MDIHPIHRKLAIITDMNTDKDGCTIIGNAELKLIMRLLKENLVLVQKLDSLKELAFHAFEVGDMEWEAEICEKIDALVAQERIDIT